MGTEKLDREHCLTIAAQWLTTGRAIEEAITSWSAVAPDSVDVLEIQRDGAYWNHLYWGARAEGDTYTEASRRAEQLYPRATKIPDPCPLCHREDERYEDDE